MEEEPLEEVEEWAESFHNSGVLGMPTLSIYIPPAKYVRRTDGKITLSIKNNKLCRLFL